MTEASTHAPSPRRPDGPGGSVERWRFLLFGRSVPGALFLLLGWLQYQAVAGAYRAFQDNPSIGLFARGPLQGTLYLAFCTLPVGIYLVRPRPRARDGRIVARVAAFTGTLILVAVNALPGDDLVQVPQWLAGTAVVILVAGYGIAVWGLLYLRNSFSIIPEARRVVRGGPYRVIRHPLYSAEILAGLSSVLAHPRLSILIAFPIFVAVQLLRSVYEERLLTSTFPEYAEYRHGTWRMIPFLF